MFRSVKNVYLGGMIGVFVFMIVGCGNPNDSSLSKNSPHAITKTTEKKEEKKTTQLAGEKDSKRTSEDESCKTDSSGITVCSRDYKEDDSTSSSDQSFVRVWLDLCKKDFQCEEDDGPHICNLGDYKGEGDTSCLSRVTLIDAVCFAEAFDLDPKDMQCSLPED